MTELLVILGLESLHIQGDCSPFVVFFFIMLMEYAA